MTISSVAIIGGGIAGPVTAMALQRAGLDATVYEAHDRGADQVGAFLTVAVNGQRALRELDLLDTIDGLGFDCPRFVFGSGTGKVLGGFPSAPAHPDGLTSRTLTRADLYRALRDEAVRRGIRIEYGKRLTDRERTGTGVTAAFADGSRATADLMVGADGLLSRTRTLIDARPRRSRATYRCSTPVASPGPPSTVSPAPWRCTSATRRSSATCCTPTGRSGGSPTCPSRVS